MPCTLCLQTRSLLLGRQVHRVCGWRLLNRHCRGPAGEQPGGQAAGSSGGAGPTHTTACHGRAVLAAKLAAAAHAPAHQSLTPPHSAATSKSSRAPFKSKATHVRPPLGTPWSLACVCRACFGWPSGAVGLLAPGSARHTLASSPPHTTLQPAGAWICSNGWVGYKQLSLKLTNPFVYNLAMLSCEWASGAMWRRLLSKEGGPAPLFGAGLRCSILMPESS